MMFGLPFKILSLQISSNSVDQGPFVLIFSIQIIIPA